MSGMTAIKGTDEVQVFTSMWTIGSSGAHTKTTNVPGTGFTGVARTAAGKYTVTFARGQLPLGPIVDVGLTHWPAADAGPLVLRPTVSSYTPETSAAAGTLLYEAWDLDTSAQTELASGDKVSLTCRFLKTK